MATIPFGDSRLASPAASGDLERTVVMPIPPPPRRTRPAPLAPAPAMPHAAARFECAIFFVYGFASTFCIGVALLTLLRR